jgi:hypothetical protein
VDWLSQVHISRYVHERVLDSELYKPLRFYSGRRLPVEDVFADAPAGSGVGPASIATDATTTHARVQTTPSERNAKRRVISIAIVVTAASVWSVACAMALLYAPTSRAFLQAAWDRVVDPGWQPGTTLSSQFPLIFDTRAAVPLLMFTAFLVGVTKHLLSRNRSKSAVHVMAQDVRRPVLFLRAFGAEGTRIDLLVKSRLRRSAVSVDFEEVLAEGISRRGPFIAIGSPAELLPRLGAARSYVDDALWQSKATEWLGEARCVLVLLGAGDGLAWELEQIRRLRLQGKTIYVLPPVEPQAVRTILERSAGDVSRTDLPASTQVIAYWTLDDGRRTIVAASRPAAQDYSAQFVSRPAISALSEWSGRLSAGLP